MRDRLAEMKWRVAGAVPVVLSLVFLPARGWTDEQLLYLLTRHQRMLPPHSRLFSVNLATKQARLLFSDQAAPVKLTLGVSPDLGEHGRKVFVSGRKSVFAYAYGDRSSQTAANTSILELSVDGSNRFRKALTALEDYMGITHQPLSQVFVNPAGTLIAYVSYHPFDEWPTGPTLVIHERGGRLVQRMDLRERLLGNYVMSIGWMPDAARLFFTLQAYEPHAPEAAYGRIGTYLINADGTGLARLPAALFVFPERPAFTTSSDVVPICVGARPDGTLLMREIAYKAGDTLPHSFLYLVDPAARSRTAVGLGRSGNLDWFRLSHDGRRVAFMENVAPMAQDGKTSFRVWVKDLESGAERMVALLPAQIGEGDWPTLVGWIE